MAKVKVIAHAANADADTRFPGYSLPLWTIHNGVFDAPTVYILTWPRFTVSVLTIYCIQRQYLSF